MHFTEISVKYITFEKILTLLIKYFIVWIYAIWRNLLYTSLFNWTNYILFPQFTFSIKNVFQYLQFVHNSITHFTQFLLNSYSIFHFLICAVWHKCVLTVLMNNLHNIYSIFNISCFFNICQFLCISVIGLCFTFKWPNYTIFVQFIFSI